MTPAELSTTASAAEFKQVMRGVASTVAIVTAAQDGCPVGMAATSFCSVSMNPPAILVCVNEAASVFSPIQASQQLCINILSSRSQEVCSSFGGRYSQEERFRHHDWRWTPEGLPLLADAQAVLVCKVVREVHHGTHWVFLADVCAIHQASDSIDPLVYVNGAYAEIQGALRNQDASLTSRA